MAEPQFKGSGGAGLAEIMVDHHRIGLERAAAAFMERAFAQIGAGIAAIGPDSGYRAPMTTSSTGAVPARPRSRAPRNAAIRVRIMFPSRTGSGMVPGRVFAIVAKGFAKSRLPVKNNRHFARLRPLQ
ncbi:MAG TPA: hypothetical protein VN632_11665 [Stellaceae bacterium]|nr:hypothetical protein [Stellaceae bacterium]